jgi:hypothetical protein
MIGHHGSKAHLVRVRSCASLQGKSRRQEYSAFRRLCNLQNVGAASSALLAEAPFCIDISVLSPIVAKASWDLSLKKNPARTFMRGFGAC